MWSMLPEIFDSECQEVENDSINTVTWQSRSIFKKSLKPLQDKCIYAKHVSKICWTFWNTEHYCAFAGFARDHEPASGMQSDYHRYLHLTKVYVELWKSNNLTVFLTIIAFILY